MSLAGVLETSADILRLDGTGSHLLAAFFQFRQ